jgi:hypothetical protein
MVKEVKTMFKCNKASIWIAKGMTRPYPICTGKYNNWECPHSKPHHYDGILCGVNHCLTRGITVQCEPYTTTVQELANMIVDWWEENGNPEVPYGDGDYLPESLQSLSK